MEKVPFEAFHRSVSQSFNVGFYSIYSSSYVCHLLLDSTKKHGLNIRTFENFLFLVYVTFSRIYVNNSSMTGKSITFSCIEFPKFFEVVSSSFGWKKLESVLKFMGNSFLAPSHDFGTLSEFKPWIKILFDETELVQVANGLFPGWFHRSSNVLVTDFPQDFSIFFLDPASSDYVSPYFLGSLTFRPLIVVHYSYCF